MHAPNARLYDLSTPRPVVAATSTRSRPRRPVRRPARSDPGLGPGPGPRLADALLRRLRYAWSRLTLGNRPAAAEAALDWLLRHGGTDGVPSFAGAPAGSAGATGGAIQSALTFGAVDAARRWAAWLLSIQWPNGALPDGALPDGSPAGASLLSTAQAARGLLALEPELPDVREATVSACRYLRSRISAEGRISAAETRPRHSPAETVPPAVYLTCLPPLLEAARRFARPDWEAAVRRALTYCRDGSQSTRLGGPTHAAAWWIEALIELGHPRQAATVMQQFSARQRRDGSVPATPDAGWVSTPGMAHLAVCWYKLGHRDQADRAMECLRRRQARSGGFRGSFGRGARYHRADEVAWAVKHYLDAAALQVQAAFETGISELHDWIDSSDGRVRAVRGWIELLPPDARVADVGCGKGRFLRHVAHWLPAARLTGIDVSSPVLSQLPSGVTAVRGSLLRIPASDGAFDGAFAVESLEHSLLPRQAVAELCRIVRPGGRVLIIDKHRRRQPLSLHEPWERWLKPEQLAGWLARDCDQVAVEPVSHLEGRPGLFLAASGRRRLPSDL